MAKIKQFWTSSTKYCDQDNHVWELKYKWQMIDERPEIFELTITSENSNSPITTSALRTIPISAIFDAMRSTMKTKYVVEVLQSADSPKAPGRQIRIKTKALPQGGQQGTPLRQELLTSTAVAYREALVKGLPVQAYVAEAFDIPLSTAAKRIMAARRAGLLSSSNTARKGATPARKNAANRKGR